MNETNIFLNNHFIRTKTELKKINLIQEYLREEFTVIRMTNTMLEKSIIDVSNYLRRILKNKNIVDYSKIKQGEKLEKFVLILHDEELIKKNVSYYKPKTKKGDPRFWVYGLKKYCYVGDLIYFTVYNNKLLVIPLNKDLRDLELDLEANFESQSLLDLDIINELIDELREIKESGWIKSINPFGKVNPRDVGDTLEFKLKIPTNNLISPDYKGKIEIKSKLKNKNTNDTLFSCVPNWSKSPIKSSSEMILTYGYPCRNQKKYPNFRDLYVTVTETPNRQGLYLSTENEKEELYQNHEEDGITCIWDYSNIERRIKEKHPKTAWVLAEYTKIKGKNYFRYTELEITQKPLLSQFILLINDGYLTFDWRGRVKEDGAGYKDKGHAFRLNPKYRSFLFGELEKVKL